VKFFFKIKKKLKILKKLKQNQELTSGRYDSKMLTI